MRFDRRRLAPVGLLVLVLVVSLVLLAWAERRYVEFLETLQGIQFSVQLTDFEQIAPQQARLRWVVTVTIPNPKTPASLELLDWRVRSADERTHLGYYTTGETQIALASVTQIPAEALIEGTNFEKLQRLASETTLLFVGSARVVFQLPQGRESKIIPVVGVFALQNQ
ncbi:MAG: hypothetical protein K6T71_05195 [Candidatus Bipolaricaulota bacterium]|nr:hypothetical protein [Candidatus Bipolaricaulota bacterium]